MDMKIGVDEKETGVTREGPRSPLKENNTLKYRFYDFLRIKKQCYFNFVTYV